MASNIALTECKKYDVMESELDHLGNNFQQVKLVQKSVAEIVNIKII